MLRNPGIDHQRTEVQGLPTVTQSAFLDIGRHGGLAVMMYHPIADGILYRRARQRQIGSRAILGAFSDIAVFIDRQQVTQEVATHGGKLAHRGGATPGYRLLLEQCRHGIAAVALVVALHGAIAAGKQHVFVEQGVSGLLIAARTGLGIGFDAVLHQGRGKYCVGRLRLRGWIEPQEGRP